MSHLIIIIRKIRVISNLQEKYKASKISFGDSFEVPKFERELGYDPVNVVVRTEESWVTISGKTYSLATCVDVESVLDGEGFNLEHIPLRDPNAFVAGKLGKEI